MVRARHFNTKGEASHELKKVRAKEASRLERRRRRGLRRIVWYTFTIEKLANGKYSLRKYTNRRRGT